MRAIIPFPAAAIPPLWQFYFAVAERLLCSCPSADVAFPFLDANKQVMSDKYHGAKAPKDVNAPNVDNSTLYKYHDELFRLSYFLAFVPSHAAMLCEALLRTQMHFADRIRKCSKKGKPLVVTSFGGGPVADLLGFLMFLHVSGFAESIDVEFHVLDLQDWAPLWPHVQALLGDYFAKVQVALLCPSSNSFSFSALGIDLGVSVTRERSNPTQPNPTHSNPSQAKPTQPNPTHQSHAANSYYSQSCDGVSCKTNCIW